MNSVSREFQGLCLQSTLGREHMRPTFDHMPPTIRKRLRESPYNLCAACVWTIAYERGLRLGRPRDSLDDPTEDNFIWAIQQMEDQIRHPKS